MAKYSNSFDFSGESEVMCEFLKIAEEEKIYNVDTGEDKTGEELIEKAHPDKALILDSYIENGGVVENQVEQQAVSREIAMKMPDNKVSRRTMANEDLVNELIILAEEMQYREENDIAEFATDLSIKIKKEGVAPLAIVGIVGAVLIPILGAYYYTIHGTTPVDYGPGKNIKSVWYAIENYKTEKLGGDNESSISKILFDVQNLSNNVYGSRKAYLDVMQNLTDRLQSSADVTIKKAPTTDDVKKIAENPQAKDIVDKINSFNKRYNDYITTVAVPLLVRDYKYLKSYLEMSSNEVQSDTGERSTSEQLWEKMKEFGNKFQKSDEEHILDSMEVMIVSLNKDIKLRTMEKDRFINTLSRPIQSDISKDFEIEKTDKSEKPKETVK